MTDAQIKLYAALRVAVPGEWRIRFLTSEDHVTVYFERPVYAEPGPLAPGFARYFRLPNHTIVGTELLAQSERRDLIEDYPQHRRYFVITAADRLADADR